MTIQERYNINLISMNRYDKFIELNRLINRFQFNSIYPQEFGLDNLRKAGYQNDIPTYVKKVIMEILYGVASECCLNLTASQTLF